jgi:hypothetical protein
VLPVNDPPTFKLGTNIIVKEDCGPQSFPNWATGLSVGPPDEAADQLLNAFTVVNITKPEIFDPAGLPEIDATGKLTFTPMENSNGVAYVTIQLSDDAGGISAPRTFIITVKAVNDAPYFELDPFLATNQIVIEDASSQIVSNFISYASPGPENEGLQTYSFLVTNNNPKLFSIPPTLRRDGTLIYRPYPNSNGTAVVSVIMRDSGGIVDGGTNYFITNFNIIVLPANDPPFAIVAGDVIVDEDCGPVVTNSWARLIKTGPPNEADQTLSFFTWTDQPELFAVQPQIDSAGNLSFTPATNVYGTAIIRTVIEDSGPVANVYDLNNSPTNLFRIAIRPINDAPTFTLLNTLVEARYNDGLVSTNIAIADPGPYETNQVAVYQINNLTNTTMFYGKPYITTAGILKFTPRNSLSSIGQSVTLGVRVTDGGAWWGGSTNVSPWVTNLTIRITP